MEWKAKKLLHGGDYNPEQWLDMPEILAQDIECFKKAHINEVSMGMFSWAVLEPEEGHYNFDWLEERIDTLTKNGISVMLSTPSGARPKWLADKYPEVLRVDENRHRNLFGGRHNHCYTSPIYREKVRNINMELAKRFGKHEGVIAWHISNEYGGECHCPLCQQAFREWLRERYGTIEELNKRWSTTFWSHIYNDFEQIESPSPRGEAALHGLSLDWKRFVTFQTGEFIRQEIQALRDGGSDKPTTVNLMYDYKPLNYHKFENLVDVISWDNYPQWHKEEEYLTALDCGMQHDIMRTIKKKPFLLMESCPSATNWQGVSKLKKPGMLKAASLHAIAHGADSVQYFQLRQSVGASEKFHGSVIDHYGGDDTRVFKEVTEVGEALEALQEVCGSYGKAKAAVVYDWENRWAMEDAQGPRNNGLFYKECVKKSYSAFRRYGLNVDMIDMEKDLDDYEAIAVPMLYLLREGFEEKLRKFAKNGGIIFLTYWSGIVDDTDRCFLGGTPHGIMEAAGLRSTEIDGLYDWEENQAVPEKGNEFGFEKTYRCKNLCEIVKVSTAKAVFTYGSDFYAGEPAVTCNEYGKGRVFYICADMEDAFYEDFYREVLKKAGIFGFLKEIPKGIEVSGRSSEQAEYIFVQNFNREKTVLPDIPKGEILYGNYVDGIEKFETVVWKKVKS